MRCVWMETGFRLHNFLAFLAYFSYAIGCVACVAFSWKPGLRHHVILISVSTHITIVLRQLSLFNSELTVSNCQDVTTTLSALDEERLKYIATSKRQVSFIFIFFGGGRGADSMHQR